MRFTFCMPVWGERYVRVMLDAGLPSQLGRKNLETFPWLGMSIYEIYTTAADVEKIKAHPAFKKLSSLMEVKFVLIDDIISDRKWSMLRYCHREAVKSADSRMSVLYFLHPDQIWTDGSFYNAAQRISEGYTAVLCPGPRSIEEQMIPALRKEWLSVDGTSMSVPPRNLVQLGMTHLHREMKMWFWHDPEYYRNPTYMFFKVGHTGIAAFCYIMHPVALNAQVRDAPFNRIFDQDYLASACPDVEKIYVCRDSDEVFHFEVSPGDMAIPPAQGFYEDKVESMSCYGEYQYNKQHRTFVKEPVRIHSGPIDDAEWYAVEEEGRRIVEAIDANWALSDADLLETRPLNLIRRLDSRYRFDKSGITEQDSENRRKAVEKLGPSYAEDAVSKSDKATTEQNFLDRIYNSHPGVYSMGPGVDKYNNTYEENTHIADRTLIFGDCFIGRQSELHGVTLYPRTRVGRYCSIARNAALGASNHPTSGVTSSIKIPCIEGMLDLVGAEIGHDVWIGTNATIMAGVTIGHGAVIGANAVVTKDVRPYAIAVGQPAREIRRRFPDDVCQALLVSRWWELPHETITDLPMADVQETLRRVVVLRRDAANIEPEAIEYLEQWLAESETTQPG